MRIRRWSLAAVVAVLATFSVPTAQADQVVVDLGTLPGGTASYASAVNDNGIVAGEANTESGRWHVVRWGRDGRIDDIGRTLPDSMRGYAIGVAAD
ncbi:hypothetical protein ACFXGA_39765, partial [Actinosynnema sp. NPDC059335]